MSYFTPKFTSQNTYVDSQLLSISLKNFNINNKFKRGNNTKIKLPLECILDKNKHVTSNQPPDGLLCIFISATLAESEKTFNNE